MHNHVVIMAGGIGSRFWPISTPDFPKQFIDILGCGRTLIQLTFDRFQGVCPENNFWVVTNAKYVDIIKTQLPSIPANHILAEPAARNTAPCIALACWKIKAEDPEANIVVTPSDAVVMNPAAFRKVIGNALDFASKNDVLVTIGIKPSRPETGYGYVEIEGHSECGVFHVKEFKEKPDLDTAIKYLSDGKFLWNAGIFIWNVNAIIESIQKYHPQIAGLVTRISQSFGAENEQAIIEGLFPLCEKISIDYAIMEPASKDGNVYTYPADFGWSDLGNWASLHEKLQKDENGNSAIGNVTLVKCKNCTVHTEDVKKVALYELDGYIISEKNGRILICPRDKEQKIKDFFLD